MGRATIFWFGRPPTAEDEQLVREHGYVLTALSANEVPDFSCGQMAIFWAIDTHFHEAALSLKRFAVSALNEGLLIKVVVPPMLGDLRFLEIEKILIEQDPDKTKKESYRIRTMPVDVHALMHKAMMHSTGPAKNANLIINCESELSATDAHLLQRAFHDCTDITLKRIAGGYSEARTFLIDAHLRASEAGPEPEPFFAKLGASVKLQVESNRFREFAEHHIPWYLRPNFLRQRSIFGVKDAILVGSFVRGSHSLVEVARQGKGPELIRSLFEETLANLYRQPRTIEQNSSHALGNALAKFSNHGKIPQERTRAAAEIFGGDELDPQELWWKILSLPEQVWKNSSIHGDLHGENVRVRKMDAIVIDFAEACPAPASADLANLEVWLAFDLANDQFSRDEWRAVIDELYLPRAVDASLNLDMNSQRLVWARDCVIEVRRHARVLMNSKDEYKRVLAVYLLRQASFPANPANFGEDEFRRTYAYWLCCQLVVSMQLEKQACVGASA